MSSGELPFATYHRAQSLGEGTYGSVVAVYDDDGQEFALKLFLPDEEEEEEESTPLMDLGALREISFLRLLRADNAHSNIVEMVDVQGDFEDLDEEGGAGTSGCLGMAMPLFAQGTLADALPRLNRKQKVALAHGLLSAVAHLHDNGFMHRDIKSDNVMLSQSDDTDGSIKPVLIDFSLVKLTTEETDPSHTGEVGTVTYTAPEVFDADETTKPYGIKSDLWSVGVILLEMIQGKLIEATKNKQALGMITHAKEELPDQPFANLVRNLLTVDPEERWSARQALESPLFSKFGFSLPLVVRIDLDAALPLQNHELADNEGGDENTPPKSSPSFKKYQKNQQRRIQTIEKICRELDCHNPLTPKAALCYANQLVQLDDCIDDASSSQGLLDCTVLASRFFETRVADLHELDATKKGCFAKWILDEYIDAESTIWMLMDYCLYSRRS